MFVHHSDGYIVIEGSLILPLAFWQIVEPDYTLPTGHIGRIYETGRKHSLIQNGNAAATPLNTSWPQGDGYIARQAEYNSAYQAYLSGANVYREGEQIIIKGPPSLTKDKEQIENDSIDTLTVTCDTEDGDFTGTVTWTVTAPDGSTAESSEAAVAGVAQLEITTSFEGTHTVVVETGTYGRTETIFLGV